jgi:hypothetical protein
MQTIILNSKREVKKVFLKYQSYFYYVGRTRLLNKPYTLREGKNNVVNVNPELYYKIYSTSLSVYDFINRCKKEGYYELNLSQDCQNSISYLDRNRFESVIKGTKSIDNNDFRYRMKFGKFLTKLGYSEQEAEYYFNQFKPVNGKFKLVEGNDIAKYYHKNTYEDGQGSLNDSCMRNADTDYFDIYKDNCKMLILLNENTGKILGRSLIWECKDFKLMDRIYGSDATIEKFKMYAIEHNFAHKTYQSYSSKNSITFEGREIYSELSISLKYDIDRYSNFPYMDTFTYLDDNTAYNFDRHSKYNANNTDGTLEGYNDDDDDYITDAYGTRQHIDEVCYVESRHDYYPENECVYIDGEVHLIRECVKIGYNWYHNESDQIVWSSYNDCYLLIDDAVYSEKEYDYFELDQVTHIDSIDDYVLNDDAVEDAAGEMQLLKDCIEIEGEFYHKESEEVTAIAELINTLILI